MNAVPSSKGHYSKTFFVILIIIDALCIYTAYHLSFWGSFSLATPLPDFYLSLNAIWILLWVMLALIINYYDTGNLKYIDKIVKSTLKLTTIHACLLLLYLVLFQAFYYDSLFMVEAYLSAFLITVTVKIVLLTSYKYLRNLKSNRIPYVVVGYTPAGRSVFRYLKKNKNFGYRFMGFFDDNQQGSLIKGNLGELKKYCIRHKVREIYFALPEKSDALGKLAKFADEHFIHFGLVQEVGGMQFQKKSSQIYDNIPVITYKLKQEAHPELYRNAFYRLLRQ
jgi:FlaA1/EpsC-like NDP-sugar epimerase